MPSSPPGRVSNYRHIFLYLPALKRLAGTLPSVYKKHSLTFVFPCLSLIRVFLLLAADRADIQPNRGTQSGGLQPAPFIKWFREAKRRAISV